MSTQLKQFDLPINEVFGPTVQGEGPDIGKACFFLRVHHCPVQCPGCDTHFTWDGSEKGEKYSPDRLMKWLIEEVCSTTAGLVISGGEPLLYYQNELINKIADTARHAAWCGLETSGFISDLKKINEEHLHEFLKRFTTVTWSPKITDCLHGRQTDQELLSLWPLLKINFMNPMAPRRQLAVKFVVSNDSDLKKVIQTDQTLGITASGHQIYLMPFGILQEEVMESCRKLVPWLARTGYILSPRLHSILWGKERKR